jgi:uncharacterized metal-binding protein YceD (DUF177 family)
MRYTHRFALTPDTEPELAAVSAIAGEIVLTNTGAALLLSGKVHATLALDCGRCLEPIDTIVATEIDESFDLITANTAHRQDDVQAVDENVEGAVIENNILNLGDLLRQNLLLAAPAQPTCPHGDVCPHFLKIKKLFVSVEEASVPTQTNPLQKLGVLLEQNK